MTWLADDDQFDSPEFYIKFVTYLAVELKTWNILSFFIIQRNVVKGDLEKSAYDYVLNKRFFIFLNLKVTVLILLKKRFNANLCPKQNRKNS